MNFHYSLVDDLMTREEFERRTEQKMESCAGLIDETTASLLVVTDCGREHIKISGLRARSSLFSFYGKIVETGEPRIFDREDDEKGCVSKITLRDETGDVRIVLWDEKAMLVNEVAIGEVLEVIGRHSPKNRYEIIALALRKVDFDINCEIGAGKIEDEVTDLDVVIISISPVRTYTKRDGTIAEMQNLLVGSVEGTARLAVWNPSQIEEMEAGMTVRFSNVRLQDRGQGREYSFSEDSGVAPLDTSVEVPLTPLKSLVVREKYSVKGIIHSLSRIRFLTLRDGSPSRVREGVLVNESEMVKFDLWGEHASEPLSTGDTVTMYHMTVKAGRDGKPYLSAGISSFIDPERMPQVHFEGEGTIIETPEGTFFDDGRVRYLTNTNEPHGSEVTVSGFLSGNNLNILKIAPTNFTLDEIFKQVQSFKEYLEKANGKEVHFHTPQSEEVI